MYNNKVLALTLMSFLAAVALASEGGTQVSWPNFGFNNAGTRYNSSETILTTANVNQLKLNKKVKIGAATAIESSSAVVSNVAYFGSENNDFYALNLSTGKINWQYATGSVITSSPARSEE